MIGVSLRASWDLNRPVTDFISLFEVDYFELQLDNPLFLLEKNRERAIAFIDELASHKPISFHLSYINVNSASLNEKMRKASIAVLVICLMLSLVTCGAKKQKKLNRR